ncbi:D-3-phosphoglycerate dehydrogenase [Cupriavidus gilardii J11]|uniref:D-3-phosphoglycerate dehydrogenase n=1 Tax=Cupriavidus gilardii J11 TaxID=936133 RepID=A0A562B2A2_9BURK|nr:NAD(P)-dependent oxidoreductase [Cupriavidus gilardii]TWG79030.1 D-3-phosphoglycerate dehydrogenase [Cupriavidus gilardii J11]
MPLIVATDHIHPDAAVRLQQAGQFKVRPWHRADSYANALADADVIVVRNPLPPALFAKASRLRAVIRHGAGLDMIPVAEASAAGVLVANVPAVNATAVAEYVLGQMLSLARRLPEMEAGLRQASWEAGRAPAPQGLQLSGSTVGIVGMGAIGQRVAAICKQGFGMRVLGVHPSRTGTHEPNAEYVSLEQALAESDFLVLACPLNASTHHLIGERELGQMKRQAFLINVARGAVVDTAALVAALRSSRIAGAALDVHETTPLPRDAALFDGDNTRLTPHVAGISAQSLRAMSMGAAEQVDDVLAGRFPPHWVNRDAEAAIRQRWAALPPI